MEWIVEEELWKWATPFLIESDGGDWVLRLPFTDDYFEFSDSEDATLLLAQLRDWLKQHGCERERDA